MAARDLTDHIERQLQIALGAAQADVSQIGRQDRQPCIEIDALLVPQEQAKGDEGVSEIMQPERLPTAAARDVRAVSLVVLSVWLDVKASVKIVRALAF